MTTPDEVQKLARDCAKAYSVSDVTINCLSSAIVPVLAKHFAARDAEVQGLREAMLKAAKQISFYYGYDCASQEIAATLMEALQSNHQEPSDA